MDDLTPVFLRGDGVAGVPVITVTGTPHTMGTSIGQRLKAKIQVLVQYAFQVLIEQAPCYRNDTADPTSSRQRIHEDYRDLSRRLANCHEAMRRFDPAQWMEFEAMATGSGCSVDHLLMAHAFTDLLSLLGCPQPACNSSVLVLPGGHVQSGHPCLGVSWFLDPALLPHLVLVRRIPDHGPSTIALTLSGLAPIAGLAESGLAVAGNDLRITDGVEHGLPGASALVAALAAPTFDDAVIRARTGPRLGGQTVHLLDRTGRRCTIEACGGAVAELPDPQPSVARVHTNHSLDQTIAGFEAPPKDPTSRTRLARLARLALHQRRCPIYDIDRWFALGSQSDQDWYRSVSGGNLCPALVALLIPGERAIHLHRGPAPAGLHRADL